MSNKTRLYLYKGLGLILFALPLSVLVVIDKDMFFAESQTKITLYGYMAIILFAMALKERTLVLAKKAPALFVSLFLFITSLIMRRFATELMYIGLCGIIGSVLSAFISPVESVYYYLCYENTPSGGRKRITSEDVPSKEGFKRAYL